MGYKETLKIDVKNIDKYIKTTLRPIYMKLSMLNF